MKTNKYQEMDSTLINDINDINVLAESGLASTLKARKELKFRHRHQGGEEGGPHFGNGKADRDYDEEAGRDRADARAYPLKNKVINRPFHLSPDALKSKQ